MDIVKSRTSLLVLSNRISEEHDYENNIQNTPFSFSFVMLKEPTTTYLPAGKCLPIFKIARANLA